MYNTFSMELKELIDKLNKKQKYFWISALLGALLGTGYYLLPHVYTASGSFYISRSVDTTKFKYFTYEGYYAQQTALSATNTIASLMESTDVKNITLSKQDLPTDTISLRKLDSSVKVNKTGPQLITLAVKNTNINTARNIWNTLSDTTIEKNKAMNENGDPMIGIFKISDSPIIKEDYKPLWLCVIAGVVSAKLFTAFVLSIKEYLKWK